MNGDEMVGRWNKMSEEVISGMAEWRQQHPKATFREIEAEVDKRLSELRARMLTDAAINSAQAEWEQGNWEVRCELWSKVGKEREEKAGTTNPRRAGRRVRARIRDGPDELLLEFQQLQQQYPAAEAIASNLSYLEKRKAQIQYPSFQAQGWPIGSGIVESGNKLVVEVRLKGSEMHWAETHVNPMLAMRNILCSDRWKEDWPKIESRLRQRTRFRRSKLRQARIAIPSAAPSCPTLFIDDRIVESLSTQLEQENLPKKPKRNPWRNFKYGKALYQPANFPKK